MRGRYNLLAFCVVAGAAINLAVAWSCAIWSKPPWETFQHLPDQKSQDIWDRFAPHDWAQPLSHFDHAVTCESFGVTHDMIYASDGFHGLVRIQTGWPLKTVEACGLGEGQGDDIGPAGPAQSNINRIGAFVLPAGVDRWSIRSGVWLPYLPIGYGALINTIFYAAIVWLLVRSPIEARRRFRQWRGLCARCGYPIGGSPVCTECGAAIKLGALSRSAS
jgi:hypothetical protein